MADERVRLFVALELPDAVQAALASWQERAMRGRESLRPVASESLHVTLCFLGWQFASQTGPVLEACEGVAAFAALELSAGQAVWLPRRRPRVLAVEFADPDGVLVELQAALAERLSAGGWYQAEHRRFLPHATVARVGRHAQPAPRALPDPPRADFTATRVTLYRSRLQATGARYEALASVPLGVA